MGVPLPLIKGEIVEANQFMEEIVEASQFMDVPVPRVEQRVGVPVPRVREEILQGTHVIPEQRVSEPFVDMPMPWIQEEVVEVAVQEFWNMPVRVEHHEQREVLGRALSIPHFTSDFEMSAFV